MAPKNPFISTLVLQKEWSVLSQVKLLCAKAHDLWDTLAVKMFVKLGPSKWLETAASSGLKTLHSRAMS